MTLSLTQKLWKDSKPHKIQGDKNRQDLIICPCCGKEIHKMADICPNCEFAVKDFDSQTEINRHKRYLCLPKSKKEDYCKEISKTIFKKLPPSETSLFLAQIDLHYFLHVLLFFD